MEDAKREVDETLKANKDLEEAKKKVEEAAKNVAKGLEEETGQKLDYPGKEETQAETEPEE